MQLTSLLGHLGRLKPRRLCYKVLYELMRGPRLVSGPVHCPFHCEKALLPVICITWSENFHSSLRILRTCPSLDSAVFSSGTSSSLFSHLQVSLVSLSSIWLLWWTLRIEFFQTLTLSTQPGTLNQASLLSTRPPPLYCPPTSLTSALTWPHLAPSRVLCNTKHSINIC